ncbi:acyl-CoA dehydrogenase family protein [Conexibacter sp. CPCC 206217]|uniref:acyl-CoA dehydrogenase family protein n=1 Tax=Conexibacter sp. CPCC 206217 TaxID=3064574 RepID=UPI00271AFFD4|nr:acyl-CoA dehydrogenase family protein [Conexibacter sp. CPCC 206217]MDO8210231.1 acyl-CoA dehydrogenase family protein [Conexibacter sp. CPCC 206217]
MTTIDRDEALASSSSLKEEVRSRAAALAPQLAEQARAIDEARRVPQELADRLAQEGLLAIAHPWRHGGEGEYDTLLAATYELGRGSGSVAWCHAVWTQHNWMIGLWPEQMRAEYFADGPDVRCSSAFNPVGAQVEAVDGGYRLSGRWSFSSGCDNAQWLMLGGFLRERQVGYLMVPRDEVEIVDTWFVSGLKGTGSKDVVVRDAFVPEHRVVTAASLSEARVPEDVGERPSYALPVWPLVSLSLTYAVMGMTKGALDAVEERLRAGLTGIAGNRPVDSATMQLRVAQAAAEHDAALLLSERATDDMLSRAEQGLEVSLEDRARWARDRAFAARLCVQAVNRLFDGSGASGLYEQSPIQRFHRDVHAGSHQPAHVWDVFGVYYGRQVLGLDLGPAARLI